LSLTRAGTGNGTLNYTYANGNQLSSISGFKAGSYVYDNNGNMTTDGVRAATIGYNMLNLPQAVTATGVNIAYTYDADGNKLRKVSGSTTTDYIDGIQYTNGAIAFLQTEEGRAINTGGTSYNYEYTLTDHLGNNRVTFDIVNGKVDEDDYYPFGLNVHRELNAGNNYLYNRKELQNEITEFDFGARFYDPVAVHWDTPDPLAEQDRRTTPYTYTFDDPIRHTDPDGQFGEDVNDDNGGGDCCGVGPSPAAKVITVGLALAGGTVAVAAPTGIGEVIAIPTAAVEVTGAVVIAGVVGLYGIITNHNNSSAPSSTVQSSQSLQNTPNTVQNTHTENNGAIYKVPGDATKSGKPYIGRHNKPNPQQTRKSNDGRDRTKAEVIDTYDPNKPAEGRNKEQKAIDDNGGVENLDNKRNEIKKDPPPKTTPSNNGN